MTAEADSSLGQCLDALARVQQGSDGLDAGMAAVLAAAVAVLGALGGAALQNQWSLRREREREAREDRQHTERLKREDLHRFANERRAAYARLIGGCERLFFFGETLEPAQYIDLFNETNIAFNEVLMLASRDVAVKAGSLWLVVARLSGDRERIAELRDAMVQTSSEFKAAVREEMAS